jgi:NADPH:quinone reductase-like Zn-dependent oxidoreductase
MRSRSVVLVHKEEEIYMKQAEKTVTGMMRAVEYDRYGPPSVLQTRTVTCPRAGHGEALVQVYASSINPIDTIIRSGQLRFRTGRRFPKRIGIDFVGEVVEIETEASGFKVGDRVWGVTLSTESGVGQGTAADFVTISTTHIASIPKNLNMLEAASISSVGAVAIIALRDKAKLRPGERLLVRGAAGGVGCMAVQLGKVLVMGLIRLMSCSSVAKSRRESTESGAEGFCTSFLYTYVL